MKKILISLSVVFILLITATSFGIAYLGGVRGLGLLGLSFFFTAGVVVVLAQLIPAGILLTAFISSIFSSLKREHMPVRAA
jgi:hypothetical protein